MSLWNDWCDFCYRHRMVVACLGAVEVGFYAAWFIRGLTS